MYLHAEEFSAEQVKPEFFEGERRETLLRELSEVITLTSDSGQRFSALYWNRDFVSNPGMVVSGGMFEDMRSEHLRYMASQRAVRLPETPGLLIDLPAHGGSDRLTAAQRRGARRGDLRLVASSESSAVRNRWPNMGKLLAAEGRSGGGRLIPDLVAEMAELDLESQNMVLFQMIGLDERPSFMTAAMFVWDGYIGQSRYHQGSGNRRLDEGLEVFRADMAARGFKGKHNAVVNDARIFAEDPSYFGFLFADSPFSDDSGFVAIERAMETNPKMYAAFVFGALDKVTRWTRFALPFKQLMDAYPDRMDCFLWPFDGHAMGIASQQPRHAELVKEVVGAPLSGL
jgi:hypothetical protein